MSPLEEIAVVSSGVLLAAFLKLLSSYGELKGKVAVMSDVLKTDRRASHRAAGLHGIKLQPIEDAEHGREPGG